MIPLTVIPGAPLHGVANSVMWVIAISYYANMAAHLSAYAGESATVAAEAAADHHEAS